MAMLIPLRFEYAVGPVAYILVCLPQRLYATVTTVFWQMVPNTPTWKDLE